MAKPEPSHTGISNGRRTGPRRWRLAAGSLSAWPNQCTGIDAGLNALWSIRIRERQHGRCASLPGLTAPIPKRNRNSKRRLASVSDGKPFRGKALPWRNQNPPHRPPANSPVHPGKMRLIQPDSVVIVCQPWSLLLADSPLPRPEGVHQRHKSPVPIPTSKVTTPDEKSRSTGSCGDFFCHSPKNRLEIRRCSVPNALPVPKRSLARFKLSGRAAIAASKELPFERLELEIDQAFFLNRLLYGLRADTPGILRSKEIVWG